MLLTSIILAVIAITVIVMYNGLVRGRNSVTQAWAGIDVQLKRRADLIPNITRVVSGYAAHEKQLLVRISHLRAQILATQAATGPKRTVAKLDLDLSTTMKQLFAVAENYPRLLADKHFIELQRELSNTENQIAAARRIYNENVTLYNTAVETFPRNMLAKMFGFKRSDLYDPAA